MTCSRGCCATQQEHFRSITVIGGLSGDRVQEGRDENGVRFKAVTDELNNTVTQIGDNRQDVLIRAETPTLHMTLQTPEMTVSNVAVMDHPIVSASDQSGVTVISPSDLGA